MTIEIRAPSLAQAGSAATMTASWIIQLSGSGVTGNSGQTVDGPEKVILCESRRKLAACGARRARWSRKRYPGHAVGVGDALACLRQQQ